MCANGTRRLAFLGLLALAVVRVDSLPLPDYLDDDSDYDDSFEEDYDVVFDQRQNGTANVRVSVDGVLLALPGPEMPPSAALAGATLLDLFASQLAAGGGSEDDSSDESYDIVSGVSAGSGSSSSTTSTTTSTTTTSTTTVPPVVGFPVASDFPLQTLPASLLGHGLSFLFNTKRGEIPFRVNPGPSPPKQAIPILVTKMETVPGREPDSVESHEANHGAAVQAAPLQPNAGRKKRKHRRKYKVRVANLLKPLLKRTVLVQ